MRRPPLEARRHPLRPVRATTRIDVCKLRTHVFALCTSVRFGTRDCDAILIRVTLACAGFSAEKGEDFAGDVTAIGVGCKEDVRRRHLLGLGGPAHRRL